VAVLQAIDLGLTPYRDAYERQLAEVDRRGTRYVEGVAVAAPPVDDALLLVEHPHVITLGRSRAALGNVLAAGDVEVIEIERGGDVTYHGPGQLVAYPIVSLGAGERDLHKFLRGLEEAVIRALARWDLDAGREDGATGVWLDGRSGGRRKICSIGIACRRWVTFHGLALNVTTDLSYFARIHPCGFEASVMTSMAEELGVGVAMSDVKAALAQELAGVLGRELRTYGPRSL
jgi:lipoyl(octanoyl) transferase